MIKLHIKMCLSYIAQDALQCLSAACLAQTHNTYSNSEGMKTVTNVIWRADGGIVLFPWLWVVVGVVSKRVRGKMTKSITELKLPEILFSGMVLIWLQKGSDCLHLINRG